MLLHQYLVAVVLLLLGECCVGVLVGVCPQYLGVSFSRDQLVDNLQRNYGTSGKDQFTAAVDLLQTKVTSMYQRLRHHTGKTESINFGHSFSRWSAVACLTLLTMRVPGGT